MAKLPHPPRPIPVPLELLPPPTAPPAVAEFEEPPPPMKMKMLLPYAVNRVFSGMDRAWGMVLLGLLVLSSTFWFFSVMDPEEVHFWILVFSIVVFLGIAATVMLMIFVEEPAAAEDQLPPPPPQIDMC